MPAKPKIMSDKCLLLKTPDNRCFFTEEKHFPCLIEFGRTFDAEISVVELKEPIEILDIDDLAKSICEQTSPEQLEYKVIEVKLSTATKTYMNRHEKFKQSKQINEFIRQELLAGKLVTIDDLQTKYPTANKQTLTNNLSRVRRELQAQGHYIIREKAGQYRLAYNNKPDEF